MNIQGGKVKLDIAVCGNLQNNVYVLGDDKECLIIDPSSELEKIERLVNNRKIVGVLITHKHYDHIGLLDYYKEKGIKEYSYDTIKGDTIHLLGKDIIVRRNPGHSEDSISFIIDNMFFTGDFLFKGSIGRTDFEGSDPLKMIQSLKALKNLDKDYLIYPGHGESSSFYEEKNNNPYLRELK